MSSHVFHELFVHLNWHTKDDQPVLCEHLEDLTHALLAEKARQMKGVFLHQLGGTDTHVHLAVQYEPFVCLADLVQELKGATAHDVNTRAGHKALEWQRGYGAVSFGRRNLPWIVEYIEGQREHHAAGRVYARLESCEPVEPASADRKPG